MISIGEKEIKRTNIFENMLVLACIISVLSQLPIFFGSIIMKFIIFTSWLILLISILYKHRCNIPIYIKNFIIYIYLFNFIIILLQLITQKSYLSSNFIYPVNLSAFIFIVSYLLGIISKNGEELIKKISKYYVLSSTIVAIYIFFNTFRGVNWADSQGYLYSSKNSISQILLVALILCIKIDINIRKIYRTVIILFITIMLIMIKSRASLVGLVFTVLYYSILTKKNIFKKLIYAFILLTITMVVLSNEGLYDFFIKKIIFNNRLGQDLNSITSGRMEHVEIFLKYIKEYWLYGSGGTYFESFPMAALFSYGILGSIPLFILAVTPIIICMKIRNVILLNNLRGVIILLNIIMLINGIFEELSPFGPGVKCFMLWLLSGVYSGYIYNKKINNI